MQGSGRAADILAYAYNCSSEEEVIGSDDKGNTQIRYR